MNRTILISALLAIALAACSKKQESAPAADVAQPAPATAPANSSAGVATPSATAEPVKEEKK